MNYRVNPKNGDRLSILGYGCMRFPKKGREVDRAAAREQVIYAIEHGVNYFDTAYIYLGGKSEEVLGEILAEGYRDSVKIATKLPHFMVKKYEDLDRIFYTQLNRLKTNRIDYYLIHMLPDTKTWDRLKNIGILRWIEEKKDKGEIVNLGFSYHGGSMEFINIIDAYSWDFCQIQYNFLDEKTQAGIGGLKYASQKGLPVIIMEPLRGGKITDKLPQEVLNVWNSAQPKRSPADWALRWVWNHEEATVVLSGMSTKEQVEENVRVASEVEANSLTPQELQLFGSVKELLQKKTMVNCTGCGYCMPCPAGVDIPNCFAIYNELPQLGVIKSKMQYFQNLNVITKSPCNASLCVKCGKCEPLCPQGVPIREKLSETSRKMEGVFFKPIAAIAKKVMRS